MANTVTQPIAFTVTAPSGPSPIVISLIPMGAGVEWSTGQALSRSSGLALTSMLGAMPLQGFSVSSNTIRIALAAGTGGMLSFSLSAFLVAEPQIQKFGLSLAADQGVTAIATLSGSRPVVLPLGQATLDWQPY
jgi:hypothetical protein